MQTVTYAASRSLNLIPLVVRGDHGTKNVIVWGIQEFFCRHHTNSQSKDRSFIYGPSTANQHIESWWSQSFKSMALWWITFFKVMFVNGLFDISINLHLQYLHFCFFGVLQHELDKTKSLLNSHHIHHMRIQTAQVVIQMYFISHPKVYE